MNRPTPTPGGSERGAWLLVLALSLLIFATIPLARTAQRFVTEFGGRDLFLVGVMTVLAVAVAAVGVYARRAQKSRRFLAVWIAVGAAYMLAAWTLRRAPEESVHLLEYGALGIAAWRALRFRISDAWIYPAAAMVGACVGMFDEAIQWLTPDRHWDLRDIGINAASASGVQLGLAWSGLPLARPGIGTGRRLAIGIALFAGTLLAGSLLNTPPIIAALAERTSLLHPVRDRGDLMVEYGHALPDPEIGLFRSRLAPETLEAEDQKRATEAAALLDQFGDDEQYDAFLERFNPVTDPFLHELRVHQFRRDRYLETARMHLDEGDRPWARRDFTVAHRENQFLERYFSLTLAASTARLDDASRAQLRREDEPEKAYESPVSHGLITNFGPGTVLGVWAGWVALGLIALWRSPRDG